MQKISRQLSLSEAIESETLLKPSWLCRRWQTSLPTVTRLINQGKIVARKIRGSWRIDPASVATYEANQTAKPKLIAIKRGRSDAKRAKDSAEASAKLQEICRKK